MNQPTNMITSHSVLEFPDGQEMCALLQEMGLDQVERHPLTLGIATLYVGRKPQKGPGDE